MANREVLVIEKPKCLRTSKIMSSKANIEKISTKSKSIKKTAFIKRKLVTKKTTINYGLDSFAIVVLTLHVYYCHTKMQLHVNDTYFIHSRNTKLTSKLEKM